MMYRVQVKSTSRVLLETESLTEANTLARETATGWHRVVRVIRGKKVATCYGANGQLISYRTGV